MIRTRTADVALALIAADDRDGVLDAWCGACDPAADLVALSVDPGHRIAQVRWCREARWVPLEPPLVPIGELPLEPTAQSLEDDRADAFDDLAWSLGLRERLALPLEPAGVGLLLLARAAGPFTIEDVIALDEPAELLGGQLAALARQGRRESGAQAAALELGVLLDLTRELARSGSLAEAAERARLALQRLAGPEAVAVLLRASPGEPPVTAVWPEGDLGAEALRVVEPELGREPPPTLLHWFAPPGTPGMSLALGFATLPGAATERRVAAVQATLSLALDRLVAQRRAELDRLRRVVEGLPEGVLLVEGDGRVRLKNSRADALLAPLGGTIAEGSTLATIGSLGIAPLVEEARVRGRAGAELFLPADGRTLAVRAVQAVSSASHAAGDPPGTVLLIDDVTEERARQSLLTRAERLATAGQLASGLAHEINNPLASVIGFAQLLRRDPDSPERNEWLSIIEEQAQRCHRLAADLLGVARPGDVQRAPVSLAALAERALATMSASLRAHDVQALLHVDPDTPMIDLAPDAMFQVMLNLLTNALHALEAHSGRREIQVEIAPVEGGVRLVVADSGPGIPAEHLGRIFDPFFTTKPEGKGTGLGLAIVGATIADQGGTLDVDSTPGRGARFIITLPLSADRSPIETTPPLPRLEGLSIVVVDDEPAVGATLVAALHEVGAQARAFADAETALTFLLSEGADAVVADLRMPRLSGLEFYGQLRHRRPELAERVIFTTGDPLSADFEGPCPRPVLAKPFRVAEALRLVRQVAAAGGGAIPPPDGIDVLPRRPGSWRERPSDH